MQTVASRQAAGPRLPTRAAPGRFSRSALKVRAQAVAQAKVVSKELATKCINAIRFLSIDGVNKAKSGHPGLPMGCAPMAFVLYNEAMQYNPKNPQFFNRDRFVLSAGHGSMLQYSMLHLAGYDSVKVILFVNCGCAVALHPG